MPKRPPKPALETRTTFWSSSFEVTAKLVCAEHQICTAIQVVLQLVLGWYKCLSFSSVPGSEFISEQKIAPKILRKNKVLWRRYSACLINNVNIYHDPESNLELPERNETIRR